jgi:muconolactone delta-isomerase
VVFVSNASASVFAARAKTQQCSGMPEVQVREADEIRHFDGLLELWRSRGAWLSTSVRSVESVQTNNTLMASMVAKPSPTSA